jgi:hypothetical protein
MTGMTDINASAEAAREIARTETGRFGAQEHSAPELALPEPFGEASPVTATIVYEEYVSEFDEHPHQVATQKVDIRSVLDTVDLESVSYMDAGMGEADWIRDELGKQGALTHPDHPFELRFDREVLDAYYDYRETNGLTGASDTPAAPAVSNLQSVLHSDRQRAADLRRELAEAEDAVIAAQARIIAAVTAKSVPNAARIVVQRDHHRYPVEVYDEAGEWVNLGADGEDELFDEIRDALGDEFVGGGTRMYPLTVHVNGEPDDDEDA